ncbi:MAG: trigger factor [Hyphomicrobiales bacterium]
MQVTETLSEGLKHEFRIVVPAADLVTKVEARLGELKDRVRVNGFRPGKVPVAHLKRIYGRSAMVEAIEAAVRDTNAQIFTDRGFKLAAEPKVTLPSDESIVAELISGKSDLDYTVAIEVLPKIELADFKGIKITKLVADVADSEVDAGLEKIAEQNRPYAAKPEGEKAAKSDRVTISFTGSIDGKPFEGGTGEDIVVHIGSNTFLPGFEDQLIGIAPGETRTVKASFPKNYMNAALAGKDASFEVTAKSIEAPGKVTIDDDFAKTLGMESLAKLRDAVKERLGRDNAYMSRQKLKRQLLDEMDRLHKFEPPVTLVDDEFNRMWKAIQGELETGARSFADENTTEEKAKVEYRGIAERRVRLGLVLAEIGEKNKVEVSEEEMRRAMVDQVRQFPGQEQQIWDYYRSNPGAVASLRAPLYEEKVVDFIVELANVTETKVSREELYKEEDEQAA